MRLWSWVSYLSFARFIGGFLALVGDISCEFSFDIRILSLFGLLCLVLILVEVKVESLALIFWIVLDQYEQSMKSWVRIRHYKKSWKGELLRKNQRMKVYPWLLIHNQLERIYTIHRARAEFDLSTI